MSSRCRPYGGREEQVNAFLTTLALPAAAFVMLSLHAATNGFLVVVWG